MVHSHARNCNRRNREGKVSAFLTVPGMLFGSQSGANQGNTVVSSANLPKLGLFLDAQGMGPQRVARGPNSGTLRCTHAR